MVYRPGLPPKDAEQLGAFAEEQLREVGENLDTIDNVTLVEFNAVPAKLKTGMITLADGSNWDPGAGGGFYGYTGAGWIPLNGAASSYSTRNGIESISVPTVVIILYTTGFAVAGDGGGATYKRVGSEPTHALKVQSADGAWWELVPENGTISVAQNGAFGKGAGFDDAPAIQECIEFQTLDTTRDEYASTARIIIPATDDFYLCNAMLTVNRTVVIEGSAAGRGVSHASILKFADSVAAGIWIQHPGGDSAPGSYVPSKLYSGHFAQLRYLRLEPVNPGMVEYGVIHNVQATFDHVECQHFKKAGFFAHAQTSGGAVFGDSNGVTGTGTMFGNTNTSLYLKCIARSTTEGHGFVAQGNNAAIMHYDTCDAAQNNGCGFRDNTTIGGVYTDCHSAQNTIKIQYPDFSQDTGLSSPFTTVASGSALVQVTKTTHNMIVGDKITIANAATLDGILDSELDGQRTIAVIVDANNYQFTSGGSASAGSQTGGGASVDIDYDGTFYMPIIAHTSQATDEPGRGANWRDFWIVITATTQDATWTTSTFYRDAGGYNVIKFSNTSPVFTGCYSEGGIEFGCIPRAKTLILGGVIASAGRVARHHDGFQTTQIYGSNLVNTPAIWQGESADGADEFGAGLGSADVSAPTFFAFGHSDDPQHAGAHNVIKLKWVGSAAGGGGYEWVYDATKPIMQFTPDGWDLVNLDPALAALGDFDTAGFAYFEDGFFFGSRPTMMASSNSFSSPVSPDYLPKGAKICFTNNATGLPHMIHCITGGKVGVLSWDNGAKTIANTDTRTGPEISAGVAVAAFETLSPAP